MTLRCPLPSLLAVLTLAASAGAQPFNRTEVTAVFFLPDGKTAVAAALDDQLHVYDAATDKERFAVTAHKNGVYCAALAPDGKTIATGGGDGKVRLWDTDKFKETGSFDGQTKEIFALAWSPDGKRLASAGTDRAIRVWELPGFKQVGVWHGHEFKVLSLVWSPDGKLLASGGTCTATFEGVAATAVHADQVRLWDPATGKAVRAHALRGTAVAFAPDGRSLAAAGTFATGRALQGGSATMSGGTTAGVGPVERAATWWTIPNQGGTLAFSPDGRLLAIAYGTQQHLGRFRLENELQHRHITVWETATGKEVLQIPNDGATVVAISPNGRKLAAGSVTGGVQFWDLAPAKWAYQGKEVQLGAKELEQLWADLADEGAERAYAAVWTLSAAGEPAVAYLKEKVQPVKALGEQVRELLAKLDSDKYATREAAFGALKKLGPDVDGELRAALEGKASPEVRKRLQKLLESWERRPASVEERRAVRAVQVLERVGSKEARAVLARLADGAPGAWLTQQARLALKRLEGR
jgi:dipeptidyl aminopeptidase/acylaminoacyl peptidase